MTEELTPYDPWMQPLDSDDLDAVLMAFAQAQEAAPEDRTLLRRWTKRFPACAEDLMMVSFAHFAAGMSLNDLLEEGAEDAEITAFGRAALDAYFTPKTPLLSLMDDAKAHGLDAARFAQELGLDKLLLGKLNRRTLDALSLPRLLVERLAQTLERSFDEVAAYLNGGMRLADGAYYKARQAPSIVAESGQPKQSFAAALHSGAQITEEDKAFWLAEIAAGRTLGEESTHE